MNAVIYTRVAAAGMNVLARRVDACRDYARELGLDITDEYTDVGHPSSAFLRLIADAANGLVTDVVTDNLDRFGRSMTGFVGNIDTLHGLGVTIHTPNHVVRPGSNFTSAHQNAARIIGIVVAAQRVSVREVDSRRC